MYGVYVPPPPHTHKNTHTYKDPHSHTLPASHATSAIKALAVIHVPISTRKITVNNVLPRLWLFKAHR